LQFIQRTLCAHLGILLIIYQIHTAFILLPC